MATLNPRVYLLTLLIHACFCHWSGDRRFSDLKRCADEECSMLLTRGKAAKDFTGPDCRFLSFKKEETIYVYYKLSGQRSDMWAGSVGNHFGYFPKDYLNINHIYTEKEFEVPAEETDFVCFDSGLDKFDSYDLDVLLGNLFLIENENLTEDSKVSSHEAEFVQLPSEKYSELDIETEYELKSHRETESLDSKSHRETNSLDSELPVEKEPLDSGSLSETASDSESHKDTESEDSESHKDTESEDSESHKDTESEDSESHKDTESEASESVRETESEDSESHRETESEASESHKEIESEDSESHRETESEDSESHRETESEDSESHRETESEDSESHRETESEASESHREIESEASESHREIESEASESHRETESEASESHGETESEGSESHRETESEASESHRETESEDSESHREIESEASESHRETESEGSESHGETESEGSESHRETESEGSESHRETESEGSESHRETESEGSESHRETESEGSESHRETESEGSESHRETESEGSESHREIESEDSESHREIESEDSESVRETESEDSESHKEKYFLDPESHKETDSLDSELLSRKASDSESHRERESLDSESLSETEKQETDKLESPENHTEAFISMSEESDSFQPKTGGKSSETAVESKEEPEKKDPETITVPDDLSLSKDVDVETEPSVPDVHEIDQSELHNKSQSESQSDSENIIEAAVEHKNQISDSKEEKRREPLNTEDKPLQTEEKTLEMLEEITEDEDVWSTIKEEERIETVPLEEITKDQELEESHAAIENLWKSSSEEQVEEDTDSNVTDTPTADPTKDSNDAEPKSYDFPTEAESAFPSVNTGESYEDDPKTHETEKENTAELQMNINENANKKNTEYNDPQDAFPNKDENIEGANSKKSITNKSTELRTSERSEVLDDQINEVKNQLENLMKNTLESEQQRPEDENEDGKEDTEELLDDENALFASSKPQSTEGTRDPGVKQQEEIQSESESSDTNTTQDADESRHNPENEEPVYSDSVLRLTILRDHLKDEDMERFQKYLGLKNLFKLEAMFSDLDHEMLTVRTSQTETEDVGNALDRIMEASENSILDETEEMLSKREQEHGQQKAPEIYDLEAAILDSFQEIVFSLRQKYSAAKESIPLLDEEQTETEEQHHSTLVTDSESDAETVEPPDSPEIHEEHNESELTRNPELIVNGKDLSQGQDVGLEEDGGHFNRNKDTQTGFEDTEDIQKGPQAMLENPLDIGLRFETDPSSGSLKIPSVSDAETDTDISSSNTSDELRGLLRLAKEYLGAYTQVLIAALPEEWRPGPTFHGVPWEPVLITAAVGLLTVLLFFWRTVLAIKGRTYQLTEKQLREKIQQLLNEKSDAVNKISELNAAIKEREEKFKNSERNLGSSQQEMKQLKTHHRKLQSQCEEMSSSISQLNQNIIDTQEENSSLNEKIVKMHQRIGKYQQTLKNFDEERAKVHVLMDEAKYREDALKAQVNSFEKENNALKEQKKSLLRDAKGWQEKHEKLSEDIRLFHKSQKDLEDSLVHKENEIDVLSGCIAELTRLGACDAVDSPNEDAKMSHGDEADKKMDTMRLRIKQMMDVSRIKATLCVVEEERNRYMESLLTEQKSRQELEEQYQKVMHDQMNLKNDKTHLENQFKNLQQRLEITTELYQQKENALQQKLTQEELERREKETKLSEVDSKALRSEDELRAFKQKIRDIEEEMQQNEQTLKNEVAIQEKKAHENWLKARASERALVEERRESATLRQKLVECSDKIADLEQSMFKLNSAPPDRHMPSMRRGDSYGPSPVSGGAPSPPLMIEGPGRPPSAPVGRRSDSFGPRPPSDPHGRFSELGHPMASRAEMFPPMTSSPCAHDGPMQTAAVTATAEASEQVSSEPVETLSKSQNQGSFLPSPIRDSPVPPLNAPLKSYGPPMMGGPIPPNGPPPLMIRPPNGHPPMMPPGPGLGPEPRFRPPDSYGPPPPMGPFGPVPPPFARGPPLRDLPPMGPLPPPRDLPPDFYGPRGLPLRPFPPGSLPPPGVMAAPPYGGRGFAGPRPLVAQSSRDVEGHVTPANNPATDRPSQDAEP